MNPEQLAVQALNNLSSDSDNENPFNPIESVVLAPLPKKNTLTRPKTVEIRRNKRTQSYNHRQTLKQQLRILQDNIEEQKPPLKRSKRMVTTNSVFCMAPMPAANTNRGFPIQTIRKHPDKKAPKCYDTQNEYPLYQSQTEDMVRITIKKRFGLKQESRMSQKIAKINNFLKMTTTMSSGVRPSGKVAQRIEQRRFKKTLTALLS